MNPSDPPYRKLGHRRSIWQKDRLRLAKSQAMAMGSSGGI